MYNFLIYIFYFYFFLISILGYGIVFQKFIYFNNINERKEILLYLGFYGLLIVTFLSLLTSYFVPHDIYHNSIFHLLGVFFFIFLKFENKNKYLKHIILLSIFLFSALLISKTHDDFSYYHLPFTKYLTEHKVIFGMGHLNHGYNLLSSLFYLNSTFYLPIINYFSFHFSVLYFLIFFNYFLLREIFSKETHPFVNYLYLFSIVYFNLSFNRLAEFGTDKAGQIIIVILIIKLIQSTCFQNNKINFNKILYLIPLLALCISLKTYFIPYILLSLPILLFYSQKKEAFNNLIFSRSFVFFLVFLFLYFSHHFISTGCLISPLEWTCFENFDWAREKSQIENLYKWLELWSKAGAGPNYRVEDPSLYIKNFYWIPNWIDKYFINKFLDQLALLFFCIVIIFFVFKNFKKKTNEIFFKKILPFYLLILVIFFIWFFKHPTLRYGGYSIFFLTFTIPISYFFCKYIDKTDFTKRFKVLLILIVLVFNIKNVNRIYKEFNRTDKYTYKNFPFYAIEQKKFSKREFDNNFAIYSTVHHCWASPTPCGAVDDKIYVDKKNGYFFIKKSR